MYAVSKVVGHHPVGKYVSARQPSGHSIALWATKIFATGVLFDYRLARQLLFYETSNSAAILCVARRRTKFEITYVSG
jgi:hypothetical protein